MTDTTTDTTSATRHRFAPQPAEPAQIDALVRALADGAHDDHALRALAGLRGYAYTAALRDARAAGWVAAWRESVWYAGTWQLTDAGRMRLAELEDAMQDVEVPDTGQVDERAEFLASAREGRAAALLEERAAIVEDYALAYEWRLSADETLADENEWLRLIVARQKDAMAHLAALESRALAREREIAALRTESATLAQKLDAALARIAELETAVIFAEPATLGDRKAQQARAVNLTPPTRKPPEDKPAA